MKKVSTPRMIASALFAVVFLGELFLVSSLLNSMPFASLSVAHSLIVCGILLLPIAAVLVSLPVFENKSVKWGFTYAGVLYVCTFGLLYQAAAQIYAYGLGATDVTAAYAVVGGKVVVLLIALLLASYEKKEKPVAAEEAAQGEEVACSCEDCAECTAEELTDAEAAVVLENETAE